MITNNLMSLKGRIALVTGSAQGMGYAISKSLSENGATVYMADLSEEKVIKASKHLQELGFDARAVVVNVTNESDINEMVSKIIKEHNKIDILVNNAGILYPTRCHNLSSDEWRKVLDVNLNGVFYCSMAVIEHMKRNNFGRIINMSSSAGRSVSTLGGIHYTASKAGVLGLTRAMAKELAPFGITINAVCPGLIATEMVYNDCSKDEIQKYEESFPISRLGTTEEVANPITFLCTESAAYITGASIDINGGDLMI